MPRRARLMCIFRLFRMLWLHAGSKISKEGFKVLIFWGTRVLFTRILLEPLLGRMDGKGTCIICICSVGAGCLRA